VKRVDRLWIWLSKVSRPFSLLSQGATLMGKEKEAQRCSQEQGSQSASL
jgi:hypothetical protein